VCSFFTKLFVRYRGLKQGQSNFKMSNLKMLLAQLPDLKLNQLKQLIEKLDIISKQVD